MLASFFAEKLTELYGRNCTRVSKVTFTKGDAVVSRDSNTVTFDVVYVLVIRLCTLTKLFLNDLKENVFEQCENAI